MRKKLKNPVVGKSYDTIDAAGLDPDALLYEECSFSHCNFSQADFSGITFRECTFSTCDLGLARLRETGLQEVRFLRSKLLGVRFAECRKLMLEIAFEACLLRMADFTDMNLRDTSFSDCDLQEADFTNADLAGVAFERCDLQSTIFFRTNLEGADFRSARNYAFPPHENRLKNAKFSLPEITGLLAGFGVEID